MSRPHPATLPRAFHRAVALLGVALVLLLGAAGVSTELHAVLHGHTHSVGQDDGHAHRHHGHAHDDHHHHPHHGHAPASADHADHATHEDEACVVNLFSQGVACVVEQPQVSAAAELGESLFQTVAEQATPTKPAGLWPPPCGPPLK